MNRRGIGFGLGGASILVVFVALCLMTFVALSLASAQADHRLSQRAAQAARSYYAADATAEERVDAVLAAAGQDDWAETLGRAGCEVTVGGGKAAVAFLVPIDENKLLDVELELTLDGTGTPTGDWRRTRWQTVVREAADAVEQPLEVFGKEGAG